MFGFIIFDRQPTGFAVTLTDPDPGLHVVGASMTCFMNRINSLMTLQLAIRRRGEEPCETVRFHVKDVPTLMSPVRIHGASRSYKSCTKLLLLS